METVISVVLAETTCVLIFRFTTINCVLDGQIKKGGLCGEPAQLQRDSDPKPSVLLERIIKNRSD